MPNIKSHIQPKFYLKGFLAPKEDPGHNDSLFVYKKGMPFRTDGTRKENNPARGGLDNIAFVKNFYTFLTEDGTEDPEKYERKLVHEIENPGNNVLRKLRPIELNPGGSLAVRKFLTSEEQTIFARYVAGMIARTKKGRAIHDNAVYTTVDETNQVGLSFAEITESVPLEETENFLKKMREIDPDFDEANGRFAVPPKFSANFTEKSIKGEAYPAGIFSNIDLLAPIILNMCWLIRLTPAENALATGDEPVFYTALNEPNAGLIFPISSNSVFCAYNRHDVEEIFYLEENPEIVTDLIKTISQNCTELYFSQNNEKVVELFNS